MHSGQWFKRRILKIYQFVFILPLIWLQKGDNPYLNISESPFPKHVAHQVWLKLVLPFLRRHIRKF